MKNPSWKNQSFLLHEKSALWNLTTGDWLLYHWDYTEWDIAPHLKICDLCQSAYLERILDSVYYHLGFVDLFYGISFVPFIQFKHVVFAIANGCQRSYCTFVRTLRVRQLGCKIISQLVHSIHSHSFTHSHSQQQINGKSNSDTVAHMRIESIDATLNFVCSLLFIDTDIRCGRLWYFSPGITLAVSSPPLTFLTLTRFILNL